MPRATGLISLEIFGHVGRVNILPEQMAWIVAVLKLLPDGPGRFPRGKWATIQHIESQLMLMAEDAVHELEAK
jgi:hypothetical protein